MEHIYSLDEINNLQIAINKPSIIFLRWDLWSWKTTLSKHIINNILKIKAEITSPTYTYYNKIEDIYHFDLYRLEKYDEFFAIWWEEILDNNSGVIIIEWPDLIDKYYKPDIEIFIEKTSEKNMRKINIKNT